MRAAQTRQRILDAAAQVFAEYGYSAGTTNRIAERAGMSIGSLYQYFPNKDAVLRALMDEHLQAGTELLGNRLSEGLPEGLEDTLRLFVRAVIDNHRDNPRLHRVLFEEAPRAPEFLDRLHELERFSVDMAAQLLARHHGTRADRLTAQIVVVTIESLVHRLVTSGENVDFQHAEDEIVLLLTGYLRAPTDQTASRRSKNSR
ncbi:putative transcriptional regulator, TetR family protein [Mycobacterium kiyosense]|uniref:Transcriptional regulator, TetR family protein n=1 Tax=Mycobacterium kiyosense TaxID=2871094 RepID=A0A9P3QD02_9MYCO|nr:MULTISPECIES: TetR/AcrR family transcriptional regulator [Mycobacterium]BDB42862.1 putative transcriptional regulator, TetR family protein [Mycobacterium kiyosense]BDE13903.1 putative transcriptional regulator, TetR family protein [Mycobacterium sp. 20KCMC460]GLB86286.1 putative transcriptional regulator, TetR family protein [Mycobacterium kiyosense]GLB92839.1 putative transcriptional regulator, TetR family protein [Mycobacterium kiyosense]GLB98972.1 putative transcriptional regulator, TetR